MGSATSSQLRERSSQFLKQCSKNEILDTGDGAAIVANTEGRLVCVSDLMLLDKKFAALQEYAPQSTPAAEWCTDEKTKLGLLNHGARPYATEAELKDFASAVAQTCNLQLFETLQAYICEQGSGKNGEDDGAIQCLAEIAFLPTLRKPQNWPFAWQGGDTKFVSANLPGLHVYSQNAVNAAGCGAPIMSAIVDMRLLLKMGSTCPTPSVPFSHEVVLVQLRSVLNEIATNATTDELVIQHVHNICDVVYRHLDFSRLEEVESTSRYWIWIQQARRFVSSEDVSMDHAFENRLEPHIWELPAIWQDFNIFRDIPRQLGACVLGNILHKLEKAQSFLTKPLVADTGTRVLIANKLADIVDGELAPFLPDSDGWLRPPNDVLVKDKWEGDRLFTDDEAKQFIEDACTEDHYMLHPRVSTDYASRTGARSLNAVACQSTDGSLFGTGNTADTGLEAYGQKEDLTVRLNGLLRDYSTEATLKEMIQNAEDAGAKKFWVILDTRSFPRKRLLTKELADWQGPALLFVNDAFFGDDDWVGITSLQRGSKGEKSGKIGRFGLGFNASFNYTDVPQVYSGHKALFLDPHVKYLKGAGASSGEPGIMVSFERKPAMRLWPDQFAFLPEVVKSCFGSKYDGKNFPGTVIRLPLRTPSTSHQSKINSKWVFDIEKDWQQLVQNEISSGHLNHIFLRSITECRIMRISEEGSTIKVSEELMRRASFPELHLRAETFDLVLESEIPTSSTNVNVEHGSLPQRSYKIVSRHDAAVATLLSGAQNAGLLDERSERQAAVCSRLPLGHMKSGSRVHISALFWPTQDRRQLVLEEDAVGEVKENTETNKRYIKEVVQLKLKLLEELAGANERPSIEMTELFPVCTLQASDTTQKLLAEDFYSHVQQHPGIHTNLSGDILCEFRFLVRRGTASVGSTSSRMSADQLKRMGISVVHLNENVASEYACRFNTGTCTEETPASIRAELRRADGCRDGSKLSLKDAKDFLKYCTLDDGFADLYGCSLCPLLSGDVVSFPTGVNEPAVAGCTTLAQLQLAECFSNTHLVADIGFSCTTQLCGAGMLRCFDHTVVKTLFDSVAGDHAVLEKMRGTFWEWVAELARCDDANTIAGLDLIQFPLLPTQASPKTGDIQFQPFSARSRAFCAWDFEGSREVVAVLRQCGLFILPNQPLGGGGSKELVGTVIRKFTPDALASAIIAPSGVSDSTDQAWLALRRILERAGGLSGHGASEEEIRKLPLWRRFGASEEGSPLVPATECTHVFPRQGVPLALGSAIKAAQLDLRFAYETDESAVNMLSRLNVRELTPDSLLQNHVVPLQGSVTSEAHRSALMKEVVLSHVLGASGTLKKLNFVPTKPGLEPRRPHDCVLVMTKFRGLTVTLDSALAAEWSEHRILVTQLRELGLREMLTPGELGSVLDRILELQDSALALLAADYVVQEHGEHAEGAVLSDEDVEKTLSVLVQVTSEVGAENRGASEKIERTCAQLYRILQRPPEFESTFPWICLCGEFVQEGVVVKGSQYSGLGPFMWQIPIDMRELAIFDRVKEHPSPEMLEKVLLDIRHKAIETGRGADPNTACSSPVRVSIPSHVDIVRKVVPLLYQLVSRDGEAQAPPENNYWLLDSNQILMPAKCILVNDMGWLGVDQAKALKPDGSFLDEEILPKHAIYFGAQVLGYAAAKGGLQVIEGIEAAGQAEPLTTRLKNVVKDYPPDSITKEMAQNADDAGASELLFIYDQRDYGTESVLTEGMKDWQGPSLNIFNDADITDKDWKALFDLGVGGKGERKDKIGKHGLGFNSNYNISDVVSVLSGSKLLLLDPHVKHLKGHGASAENPGLQIALNSTATNIMGMWPDQFEPYKKLGLPFDGTTRSLKGTLVRLPTRSDQKAGESKIKNFAFKQRDWDELVDNRKFDGHWHILFLNDVRAFVMVEYNRDGQRTERLRHERTVSSNADGSETVKVTSTYQDNGESVAIVQEYLKVNFGEAQVMTRLQKNSGQKNCEAGQFFCALPLPNAGEWSPSAVLVVSGLRVQY
jgi:hypothetical protein